MLTNDTLYQTATASIPSLVSAIKATSLVLCVMFFLIDFFTKTLHLQWVTWENVMMLFLKLIVAKVCVDNAEVFTTMLYKGFNNFVDAISGTITQYDLIDTSGASATLNGSEAQKKIAQYFVSANDASRIVNDVKGGGYFDTGFLNFQPLLLNLQITIQGLIMKIVMMLATVIVIARLFELAV